MPKTKAQKTAILENLSNKINQMKSVVMFNFSGIEVKDINKLRNNCRNEGIDYLVTKKTLLKKVFLEKGLEDAATAELQGEIAALFSYDDEVAPARILASFAKENDNIKFVGGILEGKFINANRVIELSKIPSKQELLAKIVGCISNPISGLVRVIKAIKDNKESSIV